MNLYSNAGAKRRLRAASIEPLENRLLMARLTGIDVSHYQGTGINWTSVQGAGVTFAWTKATEGLTYNDDTFTTNMANAKGKVLIGPYHYARYDSQVGTAGASTEENHYWSIIKPYYVAANAGKYMTPMLDLENATSTINPGTAGYTKTTFSQWAVQFLNDLKADLASVGSNLTPLIYTGASFASSWLDSTVSASFPVWMANYNGQNRDTGTPFSSSYGPPWQTPGGWQFWQYTSSAHIAGVGNGTTTNVDADVFTGDIYDLRDYIYGSAPRWAVNDRVLTTTSVTAWATSAANTSGTSVASGQFGKIINAVGVYGNSYWRWQVQFDNGATGWVGEDFLDTATPAIVTAPTPANSTTYLSTLPTNFTWTAGANASSYKVYLDGTLKATLTTNAWAHTAVADGTHTWRVDSVNEELTTTGTTWSFNVDTTAPTLAYAAPDANNRGATTYDFTVTYADPASGVLGSSLSTGDVLVTGPNSFSQLASLLSVNTPGNGTPRTATYRITAPGGSWDPADNGTYTLSQVASQVSDVAGNSRPADTIGTFTATSPLAYLAAGVLTVDFSGSNPLSLSANGDSLIVSQGSSAYSFPTASVTSIVLNTTPGDDSLTLAGAIAAPIALLGTGGTDDVTLAGGATCSINCDPGYKFTLLTGSSLTLTASTQLASLLVDGGAVALPAAANLTLTTAALFLINGGTLDLADNALTWDYTGPSPIDTLRSYLQAGRISSSLATPQNHMSLGYLENSDLGTLGAPGVDATALLVKYTYAGDANLDGRIDADDYAITDRGFAKGITNAHWGNGDYDYSGTLDQSDYLLLDSSTAALNGPPSPSTLAAREASFGPAYVQALLAPVAPVPVVTTTPPAAATSTFSATPIVPAAGPKVVMLNTKRAPLRDAIAHLPPARFERPADNNSDLKPISKKLGWDELFSV